MVHYLVTALVDFFVGFLALSKKGNAAAKAMFLTSFSLGLWSIELFLLTVISDEKTLSFWFHITRWGMFFIPPCFALLAWRLIGARSRLFLHVVVVPGFLFSTGLSLLNAFVFRTELVSVTDGYLPEVDLLYYAFVFDFLWCLIGAVIFSALSYRSVTSREKQRVKWILIIVSMILLTGAASLFLLSYDFYLKLVGATTNIVFVGLLFYATVQHHLMDLRLALTVGITRVVLLAAVLWSYFFITSAVGDIEQSISGMLVMLIFIVAVLEMYPRVLRWVLPNAKKLIASSSYDLEQVIKEAQTALSNSIDWRTLTKVLDYLIKRVVQANEYKIFLRENGEFISVGGEQARIPQALGELLAAHSEKIGGLVFVDETSEEISKILGEMGFCAYFSIREEDVLLGFTLIGPSASNVLLRYDDILLLEWLSAELGSVVSRINSLDEMQKQLSESKKTLSMLGVMNHYHHDIKAPLAIIDGVLSNDVYDKEKQKAIVLKQVERGSQLIATMASLLKGERKRKILPLSLHDTIKDSLFLFTVKEGQFTYSFSENIPDIRGDSEDLKILVINIVKNAMEAKRDNASLHITIKTYINDTHICVSFADTGTGMPKHQIDNLWTDVTSAKEFGSGIGMQAIKRIADEHYADIDVHSEQGKGSEFTFKFPMSIAVVDEADVQVADVIDISDQRTPKGPRAS